MLMVAKAKADALRQVGASLTIEGANAASLSVAEQYVQAFRSLAKEGNTLILPQDVGNVASTVAQAFQVYKNISSKNQSSLESKRRTIEGRDAGEYLSDSELDK